MAQYFSNEALQRYMAGDVEEIADGLLLEAAGLVAEYRVTIEDDCIGDMMSFLDAQGVQYNFEELDEIDHHNTIRGKYRFAVVDLVAQTLSLARGSFEREVWQKGIR